MKKSTLLILYCWSLIYLQLFTFPSHQVRLVCKGLRMEAGGWRLCGTRGREARNFAVLTAASLGSVS